MAGEANDKPKCPECDTEIMMVKDGDKVVPPDACAKCGFRLKGFPGFKRWIAAAFKEFKAQQKKEHKSSDDNDDFLSFLGNL